MEKFITGYCRALDSARTVLVDTEEREADCAWPSCPHDCPVGRQIDRLLSDEPDTEAKK